MFKIKKVRATGQCAAMRCKGEATDLLCAKHEKEWLEAGSPALSSGEGAAKSEALVPVREKLDKERAELQAVLERVQTLPLETQAQIDLLGKFSGKVQAKIQELDEERKNLVKPLNDEVKDINSWFKPLTDLCQSILRSNKERMAGRLAELQAIQDAALAKIQEGAGTAPAEAFEIAHTPVVAPSNTSLRISYRFEVVDAALIPEMYWTRVLNEKMIQQAVDTSKLNCAIPGIKVEKVTDMTVRKV